MIPYHIIACEVGKHLENVSDRVNLALTAKDMYNTVKSTLHPFCEKQIKAKKIIHMITHVKQCPAMKIKYVFTHQWHCLYDSGFCLVIMRDTKKSRYGYWMEKINNVMMPTVYLNETQILRLFNDQVYGFGPDLQFKAEHLYQKNVALVAY